MQPVGIVMATMKLTTGLIGFGATMAKWMLGETNGALANHMDSYFMDATSFSALR